jgi:hypothetical protein
VRGEDRMTLLYAVRELFTRVRGIGILQTSPFGLSRKFALKEFSAVPQLARAADSAYCRIAIILAE